MITIHVLREKQADELPAECRPKTESEKSSKD